MPNLPPNANLSTHRVTNQPGPLVLTDLWEQDQPLKEHAVAYGADADQMAMAGTSYVHPAFLGAAVEARRDRPRLHPFEADGRRADEVRYNLGYHQVLGQAKAQGYASTAWTSPKAGHVMHACHVYMLSQIEPGVCCPLTMTYAAVPALNAAPDLAALWHPRLLSEVYDASMRPVALKRGATMGMAMTEKQGGSDVRANTTQAIRDGEFYRLNGHKWFCSAPMSDGFLTLAQAPEGLTCFLVPRWLDQERNSLQVMRLKDKLGNHANASAEIEYHNTLAYRIGDEGAGVRTIIPMVHHTRLDAAMAPAGLMRMALRHALHWCQHRSVFQRKLIDQPLMQSVLADIALDTEGALALALRVAHAFDQKDNAAFARISVALAKFLNNKRAPQAIAEAMEALGGSGYVEDSGLPMFYREAPLNGIWEGSGNVICLDILRSLQKDEQTGLALRREFEALKGANLHFDAAYAIHQTRWPNLPDEKEARWFAESLATLLTAAALMKTAPTAIAEAYIASRLSEHRGSIAGALAPQNTRLILDRAA